MANKTIIMMAGKNPSTNIIYNGLKNDFEISKVIIEKKEVRYKFLKSRVNNIGISRVIGQILFIALVNNYLKARSNKRISEINNYYNLDRSPIEEGKLVRVDSVNAKETKNILMDLNADIIIINGTRIISENILNCVASTFINLHAGITPLYRGVHGAYWALANNQPEACGVTVHLVDRGIDTGSILEQFLITVTDDDNFITYPLLQVAAGMPLLKRTLNRVLAGDLRVKENPVGVSKLWTHPTLWEYLVNRVRIGVK